MNEDELQKLLANPTERFYMVNLIKYREAPCTRTGARRT
jgi:hypothetical protein